MLKVKIKPTLKTLVVHTRGTSWTTEDATEILGLLEKIKESITTGTEPKRSRSFIEKIKSTLSFR